MKIKNDYSVELGETLELLYYVKRSIEYDKYYYISFFALYMHKKMQYFNFYYQNRYKNYSFGQILGKYIKKLKFFKRSKNCNNFVINILKKKFYKNIKNIFFFFCKNFNYKNYIWLKSFFFL